MSKNRFRAALVALFALGSLGLADVAAACNQQCQIVTPPFCRRCVDTGSNTGQTCQNSGSCGCFYTQNNCGGLSASAAPAVTPDFLQAENTSPVDAAGVFTLDLAFAGQ